MSACVDDDRAAPASANSANATAARQDGQSRGPGRIPAHPMSGVVAARTKNLPSAYRKVFFRYRIRQADGRVGLRAGKAQPIGCARYQCGSSSPLKDACRGPIDGLVPAPDARFAECGPLRHRDRSARRHATAMAPRPSRRATPRPASERRDSARPPACQPRALGGQAACGGFEGVRPATWAGATLRDGDKT